LDRNRNENFPHGKWEMEVGKEEKIGRRVYG